MSQSIADVIKARHSERHKETKKEIKIYGCLRTKFDVSISLAMPNGFPDDKFVIEAFYVCIQVIAIILANQGMAKIVDIMA